MGSNYCNEFIEHAEGWLSFTYAIGRFYLREEEISSLQSDEEQKNLHVCLCHLQSEFYKRTLFVVYLFLVQNLMPAMPSRHPNEKDE